MHTKRLVRTENETLLSRDAMCQHLAQCLEALSSWHPRKSGCSLHLGCCVIFLKEWKRLWQEQKQEEHWRKGQQRGGICQAEGGEGQGTLWSFSYSHEELNGKGVQLLSSSSWVLIHPSPSSSHGSLPLLIAPSTPLKSIIYQNGEALPKLSSQSVTRCNAVTVSPSHSPPTVPRSSTIVSICYKYYACVCARVTVCLHLHKKQFSKKERKLKNSAFWVGFFVVVFAQTVLGFSVSTKHY